MTRVSFTQIDEEVSELGVHETASTSLCQLKGKRVRLQRELSVAYSRLPWNTTLIKRLTNDIVATEEEISAMGAVSDQGQHWMSPGEASSRPVVHWSQ
jgi:hypothetical protein